MEKKDSTNDKRKSSFLKKKGWTIVEIWEHEIRSKSFEDLCKFCENLLNEAGELTK